MNTELIHRLVHATHAGTLPFAQIVGQFIADGMESYHIDVQRNEGRYYYPKGDTHLEKLALELPLPAANFDAAAVEAAVRASQAGKIKYPQFMSTIAQAGCVYYIVFLAGKKVVYIGRDGSEHVEHFPRQ